VAVEVGLMEASRTPYDVLVVDDSPFYRKLVEHILSFHPSYIPVLARDRYEAMRIYREKRPRMVVTDWLLPDFSGIELCHRLRVESMAYTYVILMTADAEKGRAAQGLEAGADDYLPKPFDGSELLARIGAGRRIIELHRDLEQKNVSLEKAARTDVLTGLANRRAIEEWAEKQLKGASRHNFRVWLALGDLDGFKLVNDTHGHPSGDAALRAFAETLKRAARGSDMCGRLGGDEFLLVLTHLTPENAEIAVNRFREQFAALSFPFGCESIRLTASFGVAGCDPSAPKSLAQLMRDADEMLYQAKRAGRNCVRLRPAREH